VPKRQKEEVAMSGFVLHGSPHSLYTYKVALMLRLCGVGFSFRYVSFQRNADRLSPPLYGWYGIDLGRRGLLPLAFDPAVIARWQSQGEAALGVLHAHLASRNFLVGEAATIADICCSGEIAFAYYPTNQIEQHGLPSFRSAIPVVVK
jgi:glutathione S-transferase